MGKSIKKILGIVLLLLGILVTMFYLSTILMFTEFSAENIIAIFVVFLLLGLPGCIMLYFSYRLLKNTIVLKTKEERETLRIKRKEKKQQIKEEREAQKAKNKHETQQKQEKKEAKKIKEQQETLRIKTIIKEQKSYGVRHMLGLELPEDVACSVSISNGTLQIWSQARQYNLQLNKLRGVDYTSDVDIQQYTKSSMTKGILGAAAFGVAGAIIGSAPKTKNTVSITGKVIIQYLSDTGETKYMIFQDNITNDKAALEIYSLLRPLIRIGYQEQVDL